MVTNNPEEYQFHQSGKWPFYEEHKNGWFLLEVGSDNPLAELAYVEFRSPRYVFNVIFMNGDEFVKEFLNRSVYVDIKKSKRQLYFKNIESGKEFDCYQFVTTGFETGSNQVLLSDLRNRT